MYRIILADDEKLELNALKFFLSKNFGEQVELETASTGRAAIELAESFHPDLMIMDIHMPGINGLDAIREIKERNPGSVIRFIMLTAYDTFEYAQDAVRLGVSAYLTKPVHRQELVATVRSEMNRIDAEKKKRNMDLRLREKIDAARPMLEAGLVYSILLRQDWDTVVSGYFQLLEIEKDSGFFMVLEFHQDEDEELQLKLTRQQGKISALLREIFPVSIIQQMGHRVLAICFEESSRNEYTGRLSAIERAAELADRVEHLTGCSVRIGIGSSRDPEHLEESYHEALKALEAVNDNETSGICHINDLPLMKGWEEGYPQETEYAIYTAIEKGNPEAACESAEEFYDWMFFHHAGEVNDVKLKALELVLRVEYLVFHTGGRTYHFMERHGYLERINEMTDLADVKIWYMDHIRSAMDQVENSKEEQTTSHIDTVKNYMKLHYAENLTLNDMAELVHISPYYFSKLFKKSTGGTFIEYLTLLRMEEAKRQLRDTEHSVKEICLDIGYSDPNYFSRSFKKYTGITPMEYRDNQRG